VITFLPSLSSGFSVDHYPKFPCLPVFLTGYQAINTFASISFSATLLFRAGLVGFSCFTGFHFVLIIADDFSVSSCPERLV
jgi:hypothetical protein